MNNEILFKPNALILAKSNDAITASELKLYDTLLQRCQITKDEHWRRADISFYEIKNLIKDKNRNSLADIKKILELFMSVKIMFNIKNKDYVATLISDYIYDNDIATFTCSMTKEVYNTLIGYSEIGYSPIDLKLVRQAKGFYTQKLYGLLRMWSRKDRKIKKEFSIQEIKDICCISEGTSYDLYKAFKNRVLKPAVKEINDKLNMVVEYKEIKCGRKVQSIEFTFIDYEPRRYKFDDNKIIEPKEIIEEIKVEEKNNSIDSIDYMNMIDCNINESIHSKFISDFEDYKNYFVAVRTASEKTLGAIGGKTINKRNYKYFKTCLENLI